MIRRVAPLLLALVAAVAAVLLAPATARADELGPLYKPAYHDEFNDCCATDLICRNCCRKVDNCGWPLDWCGHRYGRLDLTLEGTYSFLGSPKGAVGEETGAANQLRWDSLEYPGAVGGRGALKYRLTTFDLVEARGAWLGSWDDDAVQTGVFGFSPPPTVSAVQTVPLHAEAEAWTGEASWIREFGCKGNMRVDGILGLRAIGFTETASTTLQAAVGGPGPAPLSADSDNLFLGIQLGAGAHVDVCPRFEIFGHAKLLLGMIRREVTVNDGGVFAPGAKTNRSETTEGSYGAQGEAGILWRLTPHVGITFGYSVLFLDNVVRANHGMDFTQATTGAVQPRQAEDDMLIQSIFLGVNITF